MASFKKTLMKQGMKLMSDPRVMKLMQDERVMKAVMGAVAVPGKLETFATEQVERVVKSMQLATEDEVKDLRRTVRRLEEELTRMQREQRDGGPNAAKGNNAEVRSATKKRTSPRDD